MTGTKLIVIDSIALIVRRSFSGSDSKTIRDRDMFLANISSRLKEISHVLDVSVSEWVTSIRRKKDTKMTNVGKSVSGKLILKNIIENLKEKISRLVIVNGKNV